MPAICEIGDLLRDGDQPEVVLPSPASHRREERSTFGVTQQRPGFVDDQESGPALASHTVPDPTGDEVDGQWTELLREVANLKNDEGSVQRDVCRTRKEACTQ